MRDVSGFFAGLLRYEIELWNVLDSAVQREHGLSLGRLQALRVVRSGGGQARVQDVAGDLRITVGAASKLVDRLERDGLARREPNPADRRSSLIALTLIGVDMLDAASVTFQRELADRLPPEVISDDELASITATLRRLLHQLGSEGRSEVGAA
jgi:DNA-binding MarR family transcriptional regulator